MDLSESERLAFASALAATAACDGASSTDETLAVLSRFDLADLAPSAIDRICAAVLEPPKLEDALPGLAGLPPGRRAEVLFELVLVARCDGPMVPAEDEVVERARVVLALGEAALRKAHRRVDHLQWERQHGTDKPDGLENLRNLLVITAGMGAPVVVMLALAGTTDPVLLLPLGIQALGLGYGPVAGIVVLMVLSVLASALTGLLTQRLQRVERLRRELLLRSRRVRENLHLLVEHLRVRVQRIQSGTGPRVGLIALEARLHELEQALGGLKRS